MRTSTRFLFLCQKVRFQILFPVIAATLTLHLLPACSRENQDALESSLNSSDVVVTQLRHVDPDLKPLASIEFTTLRHEFPEAIGAAKSARLGGDFTGVWGNAIKVEEIEGWSRYFREPQRGTTLASALLGTPRDIAEFIFSGSKMDLRRPTAPGEGIGSLRAAIDSRGTIQCQFFADKFPKRSDLEKDYGVNVFSGLLNGAEYVPAILIHHLLTAPWNLGVSPREEFQSTLPEANPVKVSGAGTACMRLAAIESLKTPFRGRIILESSLTAYQFYLNLGFVVIGKRELDGGAFVPLLWLPPSAAKKLALASE
jgi:hypothetical protein